MICKEGPIKGNNPGATGQRIERNPHRKKLKYASKHRKRFLTALVIRLKATKESYHIVKIERLMITLLTRNEVNRSLYTVYVTNRTQPAPPLPPL